MRDSTNEKVCEAVSNAKRDRGPPSPTAASYVPLTAAYISPTTSPQNGRDELAYLRAHGHGLVTEC